MPPYNSRTPEPKPVSGDQWAIIVGFPTLVGGIVLIAIFAPQNAQNIIAALFGGMITLGGIYVNITRTKANGEKADSLQEQVAATKDVSEVNQAKLEQLHTAVNGDKTKAVNDAEAKGHAEGVIEGINAAWPAALKEARRQLAEEAAAHIKPSKDGTGSGMPPVPAPTGGGPGTINGGPIDSGHKAMPYYPGPLGWVQT